MKHPTIKPRGITLKANDEEIPVENVTMTESKPRDALTVLHESRDLYERKNADYGDSWKLVGETMALWLQHQGVDELTIPADPNFLNSFGLFTRRMDKLIREFNGWWVADELQVSESIAETHGDDVPYGAMHTELAEAVAMDYDTFAGAV